jgi:hypothetical protein
VKVFGDDEMQAMLATAKTYTLMVLRAGPNFGGPDTESVIWEHGRRNFGLRDDGRLAVVLPVTDDSGTCGVGVFAATVEETKEIMDGDPGVRSGVFVYDVHPCMGFPGDALH